MFGGDTGVQLFHFLPSHFGFSIVEKYIFLIP